MFRHPNYNSYTTNNDITLIKLASPAQINARVSEVCVAETTDNFEAGMKCVTSGWGLTRYNGESQSEKSKVGIQGVGGADHRWRVRSQKGAQITGGGSDHRREGKITGQGQTIRGSGSDWGGTIKIKTPHTSCSLY